jgi:arsenate reductase-like glutaredoxin family protein
MTVLAGTAVAAPIASAVTVMECIDESGQKSFREFCPPGSLKKGEKKLQSKLAPGADVAGIATKHPVTIYTIPKCDTCDLLRLQLQQRGVPFTEKNATQDASVQDELRAITGTKENIIKVPVLTVDKEVVTEYSPAKINAALDTAGYPAKGTVPATTSTPSTPADAAATGAPNTPAAPGSAPEDASQQAATSPAATKPSADTKPAGDVADNKSAAKP